MISKQLPLYDLAEWKNGLAFRKIDFSNKGKPVIKIAELKNGITGQTQFTNGNYGEAVSLTRGDMVFSWSGNPETSIDVFWYDLPDGWLNQHIFKVTPSECVDKKYLYYLLKSLKSTFTAIASNKQTTGLGHVTIKDLKELIIDLPIRSTQEAISNYLYALDSKIHLNKQLNDNLLDQMQALYKSWFVDFIPFGGSKPRTWIETDIYELANIIYGAPFKSKQFNTDGIGKPIIRIRDLKEQQFTTYTIEVHPKGYLLQPGDIVVGMDGEFRPYIWGNDEAWLNQRVCVFENKRPSGKAFLYFTIKPLLYGIEQTQVATTVIHIGKKDFNAFEITLPDTSTLDNFDALTAPMMKVIVSNSFENKKLAALRDILLPKLMSGEIDASGIQL